MPAHNLTALQPIRKGYYSVILDLRKGVTALWKLYYAVKLDTISYFRKDANRMSGLNRYHKLGQGSDVSHIITKIHVERLEHDVVSYSTMLHALFCEGRFEEGLNLFKEMEEAPQLSLDIMTYYILLDGLCTAYHVDEAFSVLRIMEDKGILPDVVTYTILIEGLCNNNRIGQANMLFNRLPSIGLQPDAVMYKIFIRALCDKGEIKEAKDLFMRMENSGVWPDSTTYNVFIRGLVRRNQMCDALRLSEEMKMRRFTLNPTTFFSDASTSA